MRKYLTDVRHKDHKEWRYIFSDCTFNMAMFELELEGFECEKCSTNLFDSNIMNIYGDYNGESLHYIWLEKEATLFLECCVLEGVIL